MKAKEKNQKRNGYEVAYDATVSMVYANVIAFFLLPVVYVIFFLPYQILWRGDETNTQSLPAIPSVLLFILLFLIGIVVHELLHAAGFLLVGKASRTSIKFGVMWRALAPYAHCNAPVTANAYRISVFLPGIILGLIPGLVGLMIGSGWLLFWGAVMCVAAGGDLAVLLAVRSVPAHSLVIDHPAKPGCQVMKEI